MKKPFCVLDVPCFHTPASSLAGVVLLGGRRRLTGPSSERFVLNLAQTPRLWQERRGELRAMLIRCREKDCEV